jgi:hypothetical protein
MLWLAIAAAMAVAVGDGSLDDAYITYRYASNLAAGEGLMYTPGERAFGITEPGHGMLLGGLHAVTGIPIPWLGTAVTGLALVAIALLLATGTRPAWGAIAGATLVVSSTLIWGCPGFAGTLTVALCLGAAALAERWPLVAGASAGVAVWTRPDAGVAVVAIGTLLWWRHRTTPWRFGIGSAAVVVTGLAAATLYYGAALPTTLAAKRAMAEALPGTWGGGWMLLQGFADAWRAHLGALALPVAALGVVGGWRLWRSGDLVSRTLILDAAGLAVAYPLLGVGFYPWYVIPVTAALLYGAGTGAWWVARATASRITEERARTAAGIATALLLAAVGVRVVELVRAHSWPTYLATYRQAAGWLAANAPPGEAVALTEVGVVGYFSDLPVLDLLGLVTPAARDDVREGRIGRLLKRRPAAFVVEHTGRTVGEFTRRAWFEQRYRAEWRLADPAGGEVVIFRLRDSGRAGTSNAADGTSVE